MCGLPVQDSKGAITLESPILCSRINGLSGIRDRLRTRENGGMPGEDLRMEQALAEGPTGNGRHRSNR